MKNIWLCIPFIVLLAGQFVSAQVLISEVLYDPLTSDYDSEFVELFNTGELDLDISGWVLRTTSVQGVLPNGSIIKAGNYFLIKDIDNTNCTDWPRGDFEKDITLTNTDSGVALIDLENSTVDALGWGNPPEGLYLKTPHNHVKAGESLARRSENGSFINAGNNTVDFLAALPNPQNSGFHLIPEGASEIGIAASVEGNRPRIDSARILEDDNTEEGIQVMPIPGGIREINVEAVISDEDGFPDIGWVNLLYGQKIREMELVSQINATSGLFKGNISLNYYEPMGNYTIGIAAGDESNSSVYTNLSFEYLGIVAFDVDTIDVIFHGMSGSFSDILGDLDFGTAGVPTVRNMGNTKLDFLVSGTDLESGAGSILSRNLLYTFLDNDFNCSLAGQIGSLAVLKDVDLSPAESSFREFSLRLKIPAGTVEGEYMGSVYLRGVESKD